MREPGKIHRSAVTAVDKLAVPDAVVLADVATGGSLLHTTKYYGNVSAYNKYGVTGAAAEDDVTTAADANNTHVVRMPITKVDDAEGYDLFMSTDAKPKWVARITEAMRAAGGRILTVGGTFAGDLAVDIGGKIRTALGADPTVSGFFTVGGAGASVQLTAKTKAANDVTMNIAIATGTAVGVTAAPLSADSTPGVAPVLQQETATVGVGAITTDGHLRVTVTANGMTNSPKQVLVAIVAGDTAATIGPKIRAALIADVNIGHVTTGFFVVTGSGADIILTAKTAAADDATMNVAQIDGKAIGVATTAASVDTLAGVAPVQQIETATIDAATSITADGHIRFQVTANSMTGSPKKVLVAVASGDDEDAVATKVRAALISDANVGHPATGFFTVTGAGPNIILTAKTAAANDGAINVVQSDGQSDGITTTALSVHTLAGHIGTLQVETATVVAAADITGAGFARIVITAPGMVGTPITIDEYVGLGDTATEVADALKARMGLDTRITDFFTIGGVSPDITLTCKVKAADSAINMAISNNGCTGLTDDLTSTDTTPGVAPRAQIETATIVGTVTVAGDADVIVTAAGMAAGVAQTCRFPVAVGDNPTAIAAKARIALAAHLTINAFFDIGAVAGPDIVLTAKVIAADDATMNIASQDAAVCGVVPDAFSVPTLGGNAGTLQIETATVVATVTAAGDADVIVASTPLAGASPHTTRFAVAAADDASAVALKARTALGLDGVITALYTVGGAGADIILTAKTKAADDAALNIATQNSASNGAVTVANSVHTRAGVLGTAQIETATAAGVVTTSGNALVTVVAAGMGTKVVTVPVSALTGATPGVVDIYVVGTGLASNVAPFIVNNAYTPDDVTIAPVGCYGYKTAYVQAELEVDDLRSMPSLVLTYWTKGGDSDDEWTYLGTDTMTVLTAAGQPMKQSFDLVVDQVAALKVLVGAIAGQGAKATIQVELAK